MDCGGLSSMTDFHQMSKAELRAHIVAHPRDQDAFRVFVDRFSVACPTDAFDMPNTMESIPLYEQLILQRLSQVQAG
jgi:hypothetical protein